jgi:hypothetical protein
MVKFPLCLITESTRKIWTRTCKSKHSYTRYHIEISGQFYATAALTCENIPLSGYTLDWKVSGPPKHDVDE